MPGTENNGYILDENSLRKRIIKHNPKDSQNEPDNEEILINQLFAGAYLQEGTNIGHEVINLFRDDEDRNYLFITPGGVVSGHNVDSVLFVQNIEAKETMEVVMKAEGLSSVSEDEIKDIRYAGVSIVNIFSKNMYHGEIDTAQLDIFATYRADSIKFPKSGTRIILTVNKEYEADDKSAVVVLVDPDKSRLVGQGMRTYLSKDTLPLAYANTKRIIDNRDLWETENTTEKLIPDGSVKRTSTSFLEIIRKENDELIFSNLLAYYFNYDHHMFMKFADEILGIPDMNQSFDIIRESMKNIDLWIEDENHIVVIENKIKSGLNGKTDAGQTQLDKYYHFAEEHAKKTNKRESHYFIFVPNYNVVDLCDSDMQEHFRVVTYSEIYKFFKVNAAEYIDDKYFPDFLRGLYNHTMTYSELRFNIMRSRFLEKVNQNI